MHDRTIGRRGLAGAVVVLVAGLLLVGLVPAPSDAAPSDERFGRRRQMLALTNEDRSERSRRELAFAARLSRYAKAHSRAMARDGHIYHSTETRLRKALEGTRWQIAGENVGVGGSLESLQSAFMASKLHRQNVLRTTFDHAAIGVVRDDDRLWVTVIFFG